MTEVVRYTKKFFITLAGVIVIGAGILLSLPGIPGPGLLLIIAGMAILATEYVWAEHLLHKLRLKAHKLFRRKRKASEDKVTPPNSNTQ